VNPLLTQRSHIYPIISFILALTLILASFFFIDSPQKNHIAKAFSDVTVGGCPLFPADNIWNRDISTLPIHRNSANYIASIGPTGTLHVNFGAGLYGGIPIGMPYIVVPGSQPYRPVNFTKYGDESDAGPYPIPPNAPIEGGSQSSGDRHVIVVDSGTCKLYEMFESYPQSDGSWNAGNGVVWNLNSDALRPSNWTSADAAGLPILPGLVRYDEVASGIINHALRFTVNSAQRAYLWPARHSGSSSTNPNLPPMGLRLRLKANVNISSFSRTNQIILTALKRYGMIVADNGTSWVMSGAPDNRWNNHDLYKLEAIPGSDFEAIDESNLQVSANSGQAAGSPSTSTPLAKHSPTKTSTSINLPVSTPKQVIVDLVNTKRNNSKNSIPGTGGSSTMLSIVLGSVAVLITILVVGSRFVLARRPRKRGK
jgi:hypothetical protein